MTLSSMICGRPQQIDTQPARGMMQSYNHFHNRKTVHTSTYPLLFRSSLAAGFYSILARSLSEGLLLKTQQLLSLTDVSSCENSLN
jgi:hypothetical protein